MVASTEDAFYKITEVLKGDIPGPRITVEHLICWDTVTVDSYYPNLSPELFKEGNNLLLFLKAGSHGEREGHVPPREFPLVFQNVDENCGAVKIDDEAALDVLQLLKSGPVSSKRSDPSPDQQ